MVNGGRGTSVGTFTGCLNGIVGNGVPNFQMTFQ